MEKSPKKFSNKDFSERLQAFMDAKRLNQTSLSKLIDKSRSTISSIFVKNAEPGIGLINAISSVFPDLNIKWLISGEGSMFLDPSPATIHNSVVGHGNLVVKDGINTVASSDGRSDCAEIKKQLQEAREEIIRLKGQVELLKELLSKKH